MNINCILAGVGGQGTVLASKLIADAAMNKGLNARTAETIGMAQRGGCVVSHVKIGEEVFSPMISENSADLLIGFEPAEAVRCLRYLKKNATVIVAKKAIKPVTSTLSNHDYNSKEMLDFLESQQIKLIEVDGEAICNKCGSAKVLNVALLGTAIESGVLGITADEIKEVIKKKVKEKFIEMNLQAFELGQGYAK